VDENHSHSDLLVLIRSAAEGTDACTDYALEHGLPDRLGPLATAAGTSNRMLIYHFGTRDGLLREVLGQARQRQVEALDLNLAQVSLVPLGARIRRAAGTLAPASLRTLDAIHLATALALSDLLDAPSGYDARLLAAARDRGIAVLSPAGR
jgi:AcrR family transcriptional regulator